jgi:hypothetical protein
MSANSLLSQNNGKKVQIFLEIFNEELVVNILDTMTLSARSINYKFNEKVKCSLCRTMQKRYSNLEYLRVLQEGIY